MSPRTARRRLLALRAPAAAVLVGVSVAACGGEDPFAPKASLDTVLANFQVYALSTAPTLLPTAVSLYGVQSVRPAIRTSGTLNFDLAFDVDAAGRVRMLPPKLLVAPQGASLTTGMQVVANTTFDALSRAPSGGYQYDSATVVTPGQVVAVQTQGAGTLSVVCSTTAPLYAKLVVDSVRPAAGTQLIYLRARIDPNCGFRSLESGLPTS